ncbi:hypothetical protein [Brevibacillus laterosporus]|nr:hypothetical protein [Brevibacillus laterosporus]MDN9012171.1 hypothetical protein [Brevibacillus laterosporus]MDO0943267.1 hypothetical protein [Brevibacillus laterosporus]
MVKQTCIGIIPNNGGHLNVQKIIVPFLALSLAFSVSTPFQVQAKEKA